jgi:phosphatidate cytidylyltransferase
MVVAPPGPVIAPTGAATARQARYGLKSRIIVGVFLAVLAIADIVAGGVAFALMVAAGVMLIFWEWAAMHAIAVPWRLAALGLLGMVSVLAHAGEPATALLVLGSGIGVLTILSISLRAPGKRWISTGLGYAGLPAIALIWLRGAPDGFNLVIFAMAIVWATDVFAYFAGRSIGGPRLLARISPNKTWAGLGGGMLAAGLFSAVWGHYAGWAAAPALLFAIGAALAVLAQAGDLFESWLKRRAGVKDSGRILLGHGGIMDRVDGLVPVACAVALWVAYHGFAGNGAPVS